MAGCFLVHIAADGSLQWCSATGTRGDGAPPAGLAATSDRVVALVPTEDVLLTTVELPRTSAARQRKALPFALEDQVLDAVDGMHFALGPAGDDGRHTAAAVSSEKLETWLARLREAGVQADVLCADALALPLTDDAASVLVDGDRALVRTAPRAGFACDAAQLGAWLAGSPAVKRVVLYRDPRTVPPRLPDNLPVDAQMPAPGLATLARGVDGDQQVLNLLQDDYAPHHRREPQRRWWRAVAALALLAALLVLATQITKVVRLRAANARITDAIAAVYAKTFPQQPIAADPVARTRSALERLGGGSDAHAGLLPLLARIAPILHQHSHEVTTLGMDYRNATLELAIRVPNLSKLDALREQLASVHGLKVELTAATPGKQGVDGRLRIRGGGS